MLSTADSVIVFIFALIVISIIFFTVTFARSTRGRAQNTAEVRPQSPQSGAKIPLEQTQVADRLDPSSSAPTGTDPRGVDIGGTYN